MIRARGLVKRYGDTLVFDGLEFRVEAGERAALVGLNGAGKTTLFRCLLGLTGFEGQLTVEGHPAGPAGKEARRRLGYVPQRPPVYDLTLSGFVELFSGLRSADPGRTVRWLDHFGLPVGQLGDRWMGDLSGGMLQKALLALALGTEAPALLLDEPTASLDPGARRELLEAIRETDERRTILFATHRTEEIDALAERVLVLGRRRLVFDGTVEEFRRLLTRTEGSWIRVPSDRRSEVARTLGVPEEQLDARPEAPGLEELLFRLQGEGAPLGAGSA